MILYFSGTGNTRHCAQALAALTGDRAVCMQTSHLREPGRAHIDIPDKRFILMFPTYSWGLPPVVAGLLSKGTFTYAPGTEAWMVTTCGDDIGNCARQWRKAVSAIGLLPRRAFSVQMPNTYISMSGFDVDSADTEQSKIDAMPARIRYIAEQIVAAAGSPCDKESDDVVKGKWAWLKTAVIYPWFTAYKMSPKPFHATDSCSGCGHCARTCPMDNITPGKDGRPTWGQNCAMCLRCYHACPQHAVQYGKATARKGQYTRYLRHTPKPGDQS